ncbi:MAG: FctA domain-containing protein [Parolsenella sp.]|uniref:Spy0128 family protein n=1 Tax=Parolsenella sp. TaxID=2083006 RepID=UPI002E797EEC|nr:FctA domain-containing protein [Parolsenella sp.]MEE1372918.1 FctA domain-containing protein [Parolsenella sp.]
MKSNGHASRSWRRRLFAAAATVMLALGIATPTAALAENAGSVVDRMPAHSKTIKDNPDGTYDLTLSVTGDTEQSSSATPVDVVFVVDVSSSMNDKVDGWFGKSRMKAAHDAAATLANSLLTGENANKQIQVSVVTFGTNAQVATGFTSDPSVVANAVPTAAERNQGTNWEGGLKLANAQTSGREGAEKHIVFLSDGNPTYRVSPMGYTRWDEGGLFHPQVDHKEDDNLYGFGNSDTDDGRCYAAAKAEANNRNGANLFVVSVAKDADKMQSFATDTNGTFLDGTTADNLANAFAQIGQVITKSAGYKDVKIVDQLTQWVEGTAADGSIENVRYAKNDAAWDDAPSATTITINGGNLSWDLSKLGTLEKGVTYSVTFTIRPSDAAYAEVAAAGEAKTFPTNVDASSYVAYKTVQTQTGQVPIVSDAKTANFNVPTIRLAAPASVAVKGADSLVGLKTLKGRALAANEFKFTISPADGSAADTPLPAETTVFNEADGSFHFGDIAFAKTGTYLYDVAEDTSALPKGVKPVTQGAERVKVDVTVNEAGELVASVTAPEGGLSFVNEYGTNDATVSLHGRKSIDAAPGLTAPALNGGDYQFTLTAKTVGAPMPANQTEAVVSNDAAGDFHFDGITFTKDDLGNEMSKTFEYTVTESGSKPGVANVGPHTVKVTVTDDGEGNLTAKTEGDLNFVNTYSAAAVDFSVTSNVKVRKHLEGRDLMEGEFTFELVEGNKVVATATNAADGAVVFGTQNYTKPGTHFYTIREAQGNAAGVSYDPNTYTVTVNVKDNGEGQLDASTEGASEIVFNNTYTAKPATVDLTATKALKGADLSDGQFTFELLNNGGVMDSATNDAEGNVAFRELTLRQAGTYTFTMLEVAGDVEGMTYDNAEYTVKISVKDDNGQLVATVEGNNPTFTNSYTAPAAKPSEPEQPAKQLPQTGDTNNATLPIVFAVAAVVCIAAGVTVSRKRK